MHNFLVYKKKSFLSLKMDNKKYYKLIIASSFENFVYSMIKSKNLPGKIKTKMTCKKKFFFQSQKTYEDKKCCCLLDNSLFIALNN